jgi:GNAT superfamily N-acetyltransferase
MNGQPVRLREAAPGDADELTGLYRRARAEAMPWLAVPHDEASTRWWIEHLLLPSHRVRVADRGSGRPVGFAAVDRDWLRQLYVHPDHQHAGVGRALLDDAKRVRPGGLTLHVFTRNAHARRFYETAGFLLVEQSDGSTNEEREPDCTYTWAPDQSASRR